MDPRLMDSCGPQPVAEPTPRVVLPVAQWEPRDMARASVEPCSAVTHPVGVVAEEVGRSGVSKLPEIAALFWVLKMAGTTLGETAGDFISEDLGVGFLMTFFLVMAAFLYVAWLQVRAGRLVLGLYWTVIVMTSMAGTEMADFIFNTIGIGVTSVALGFIAPIVVIYLLGKYTGGSFSVTDIRTRRDETLFWALILTTNTIGTGIGDGLGITPVGVLGGTILIATMMLGIYGLYATTTVSRVALFWTAFVLTRPLGATGGDLLSRPQVEGGLGLGRVGVSIVLLALMAGLIWNENRRSRRLDRATQGSRSPAVSNVAPAV